MGRKQSRTSKVSALPRTCLSCTLALTAIHEARVITSQIRQVPLKRSEPFLLAWTYGGDLYQWGPQRPLLPAVLSVALGALSIWNNLEVTLTIGTIPTMPTEPTIQTILIY